MSTASQIALMAAQTLPEPSAEAEVPEWVHLLPAGTIQTADSRGPYHLTDAAQAIEASFAEGASLPIDVNHAIQLGAPRGEVSPASGWIEEMQAREDGIWGRVTWTKAGRELVADRAYRGLSPVIRHDRGKKVLSIIGASLVNKPNLRGLTALNMELQDMNEVLDKLKQMLGLDADCETEEIWRALSAVIDAAAAEKAQKASTTAMQSALSEIGEAFGLGADADAAAIAGKAKEAAAGSTADDSAYTALQQELSTVTTQLNELRDGRARERAEAFVDGAIRDKRVGVSPQRDRFVSMHMKDPEGTEELIAGFPSLGPSGTSLEPPKAKGGTISLNAEQAQAAKLLGISPEDYRKTLEAEGKAEEAL